MVILQLAQHQIGKQQKKKTASVELYEMKTTEGHEKLRQRKIMC